MKKMTHNAWIFLVVAIAMLGSLIYIMTIIGGFDSKLIPLLVSGVAFCLAIAGLARELVVKSFQEAATEDHQGKKEEKITNWKGYLINIGWAMAFLLGIMFIGLPISIFLFVLLYMKYLGTRWTTALIFSIATPVFIWAVFEKGIGIQLFRGFFFGG